METKIYIDPRSAIFYSSFYIKGLYGYFGKRNVSFSTKYFKELDNIDILMAFVIITDGRITRYIIDYRDQNDIIQGAYEWCNIYAKININNSIDYVNTDKLIHIPPGFGIRIWTIFQTLYYLVYNFFRAGIYKNNRALNIHVQPKRWVRGYLSQIKRQSIDSYKAEGNNNTADNYIFFVSTYRNGTDETNQNRNQFIVACSENKNIRFEGGFFVPKSIDSTDIEIAKNLSFNSFLSNSEYMRKIKQSIFVFNTPAVHKCHGWKLGEFLAMGKAIITTPFYNDLPFQMEHSKEILIVNNEKEIREAVQLLWEDKKLRKTLERNAKQYYDTYASPYKVIQHVVK